MDSLPDTFKWDEDALRLEVLRRLYATNQNHDQLADGLSPSYLMKELNPDLSLMESCLEWLLDNEYVYVGTRAFLISAGGIKFLAENDGLDGPNHFSPIPRKPAPNSGDVAANLQSQEENDENA